LKIDGGLAVDQDKRELERVVLSRVMRLNETIHGIVAGLIGGAAIFIATNWLVLKGGSQVGQHLGLLSQYFIGYRVTFLGSLIGCGYGFILGFVVGFSIAKIYNWFIGFRERVSQPPA
jgi:hypothetical protein